jgi:hypothetical protein
MPNSNLTSEQFGAEMGKGWKEAIHYIYPDAHIITESKIKRKNSTDAGDVDIAFSFKEECKLISILPSSCFFRPDIRHKKISTMNYMAEIKRSCPLVRQESNIKQFVAFYYTLLGPGRANLRLDRAPNRIRHAVDDANSVLLFVFNGADNVSVYDMMKSTIEKITGDKNGRIMGHLVVNVWCPSADLIKWRDLLEKDAVIEEKDAVIEEKDAIIEKVIEEKDAIIEKVIEEKDAVIEELQRRLNEYEHSSKRAKLF